MEKEFIRVRSAKNLAVSISLAVAGIAMVAIPTSVSINIAGFTLAATGIALFFTMKSAYKDKETGKIYCRKQKYFQKSQKEALLKALGSHDNGIIDIPSNENADGLKADFYYSAKESSAYVRIYEYVPYQYVPASQMFECQAGRLEKFIG
ncbi:MAG: hypothetical protein NC115_09485 [Bacteroidales bacterium]|nr:hypothetical protein [Bacteroides sp.]MCM1199312.1 hypothetical protein [Clostridium sp.]MCM1502881.1 hypothetical protein [Bacteroidales bacterium]